MYNLSVQTFQIRSLITQDLWIVQIIAFLEFDKRVVKAKIDFLISASKLEILFNTNISLALLRRLRPNTLRYTLLYATRSLENVAFFVLSPKIRTIKCSTKTPTQFNENILATFIKHPN